MGFRQNPKLAGFERGMGEWAIGITTGDLRALSFPTFTKDQGVSPTLNYHSPCFVGSLLPYVSPDIELIGFGYFPKP